MSGQSQKLKKYKGVWQHLCSKVRKLLSSITWLSFLTNADIPVYKNEYDGIDYWQKNTSKPDSRSRGGVRNVQPYPGIETPVQ